MSRTCSKASEVRSACYRSRQLGAAFWRGWDAGAAAADNLKEQAPLELSCGGRNPYWSSGNWAGGRAAYRNAWAVGFDCGFRDRRGMQHRRGIAQ